MPDLLFLIFFFALGACIGSFLNVVVWRLPRNESLVSPPSHCPRCDHRLAWYDNIPVLGWIALRGRCRYCFSPISPRYPVVEFITGGLFVFYYVMMFMQGKGPCEAGQPLVIQRDWAIFLLYAFTIACLLAASLIDAELFWIPQPIPMLMAGIGLLYHTLISPKLAGSLKLDPNGFGTLISTGAGLGLVVSLILLKAGKLKRSFAQGYPALEVETMEEAPKPAPGRIARLVSGWIEAFRGKLTAEQQATMERAKKAAEKRDKEIEEAQKREMEKNPPPPVKEFTKADIRREMRHEMAFLIYPMMGAIVMFCLGRYLPGFMKAWQGWMQNSYVNGFLAALLGGMVGAFTVWLTRILGSMAFGREAMGMGDVDLMFGVGAIIGAGASVVAFFVAPFFGIILAIYMLIVGKRRELPYGPYLSLGTAFVMLYYCDVLRQLQIDRIMELMRGP